MNAPIRKILDNLVNDLSDLDDNKDNLYTISQNIKKVRKALTDVKSYLLQHRFISEEEEINFFKTIKPQFDALHIYYNATFQLLQQINGADEESWRQYCKKELKRIQRFFNRNQYFYQYYFLKNTHLDHQYFRLNDFPPVIGNEPFLIYDEQFHTSMSIRIAQFIAYEKLQSFILTKLNFHTSLSSGIQDQKPPAGKLKWKGPKVGLVELGYAAKEAGALEEPLQVIFDVFEQFFSVQLKNTSRTFQEIMFRKKEEAVYLEKLTIKLKERRDRTNENYTPRK